jgi:hypothetical protein
MQTVKGPVMAADVVGKSRFYFRLGSTLDGIESVDVQLIWPGDPLLSIKTPKFDRGTTMIEYISRLQLSINKKMRRTIHGSLQRELFLTQMVSHFKNFVLEYDDVQHTYLSLYILMSAPSENEQRASEDILGAAVVNSIFG